MNRVAALLAISLALTSCTSWRKMPLTGLDHPSGWADQIRGTATETYLLAQLSSDVYDQEPRFVLPSNVRRLELQRDDPIGFGYGLYEWARTPGSPELALAFRGTDFSQREDWAYGNIIPLQNRRGLDTFRRIRAAHPGKPIHLTGHSLGGGIATYVSLVDPVAQSVVFNSSPRFRAPRNPARNRRTTIVEYGEILKATRLLGREADQLYMSIGCTRGGPIHQHTMRLLAECLTRIAAHDSETARESLRLNPNIRRIEAKR
ncbi:MAG TPA: hypothetical protein VEB39_09135 [Sphingomicrobium sp.]|nr:hypothetical protein [Sphingomicrobium sp.]